MAVETASEAIAGPCLVTASEPYWSAYLRGFTAGHFAGYELRRTGDEAADAALFAETSRKVRARANSPTYVQLCDRRGEPERARAGRAHERRLGLAS